MRIGNLCVAGAAVLAACGVQGCGGGDSADDRPERVPVSGVVTYNGSPVEGATVTFKPTATDGRGAAGRTDEDGNFVLGTFESDDGAMPGSYIVTVTKITVPGSGSGVPEDDPNYSGAPEETESEPKNELPENYADAAKTDLKAEVGAEGATDLKFELTD